VATVGAQRIPRAEFDARVQQTLAEFRQRSTAELPAELRPLLERQVLENLIRARLLVLEAPRAGVTVSAAEAEAELRREPFFQENGRFSEARFAAVKASDPARFASAVAEIRAQMAARRLSQQLERRFAPPDAELRRDAERALARVTLSLLPLRFSDFDGGYDEPRESDVIAHYRAHRDDHRRPERARLTLVFVDRPALADSLARDPAAVRAWEEALRPRAEQALAALRAGASPDSVGAAHGGLRRDFVVTRGAFPDFWAEPARGDAAVFSTPAGAWLAEPMRSRPGWLLARAEVREPARVATLAEVARDVRARLRLEARGAGDELRLQALYARLADSLTGPAVRVRYAAFDRARVRVAEPGAAELERFYRGHLADYSSFDAARGAIVARPLAEVRDDVRRRMIDERRDGVVRDAAERLHRAWSAGRRDAGLERAASALREVGPVPPGVVPDSGLAALVLRDSIAARGAAPGVGVAGYVGGRVVWQVTEVVPGWRPTYEQARPRLAAVLRQRRESLDESGAYELWSKDPQRFAGGPIVHVGRVIVPMPRLLDVPLTRDEVERWHREHLSDYAAGEAITARHIMFAPASESPADVEAARQEALAVLARLRAGERFEDLAERLSDDVATRSKGGSLGTFGRGAMLDAFERAVFAMKTGEISEPVRSEVGWHVIEVLEHLPLQAEPLAHAYTNVASDAARVKAERMAQARAESLLIRVRTPADIRAAARRLRLEELPLRLQTGAPVGLPDMVAYVRRLERMKPGEVYPSVSLIQGLGYALSWVDSVAPSPPPTWEQARERAVAEYRAGAAGRAIDAKRAELDSMLASGWSLDSLGALFGGLEVVPEHAAGGSLPGFGPGMREVDSLAFGAGGAPPLPEGQVSGWVALWSGYGLVRVDARLLPPPMRITAQMENERRIRIEERLREYFDGLRQRHPVRILDARIREIQLPPPPTRAGG
jgi:parvulin-like peptidyl-prolyl isomerase